MIALSRLERDVVLSHFEREGTSLYIRVKKNFLRIEVSSYRKAGEVIFLLNEALFSPLQDKEICVYFLHKKVKICFKTLLKKDDFFFFEIPGSLYIKRKKKYKKDLYPHLELYSQNLLISTFSSSQLNYSCKYKEIDIQKKAQKIFNFSREKGYNLTNLLKEIKQNVPDGEELYSHLFIINRFLRKKEKDVLKKRYLYVFSDSHLILLFASVNFAKQFEDKANKNKILKAKISFKDRTIFCNVCYSFFCNIYKDEKNSSLGFLALKIVDIQEEDKRYLYESIFSKLYMA